MDHRATEAREDQCMALDQEDVRGVLGVAGVEKAARIERFLVVSFTGIHQSAFRSRPRLEPCATLVGA
jgi:hypothetical protein